MSKVVGTVLEVDGTSALIQIGPRGACKSCSAFCSRDKAGEVIIYAQDPLGVKEGDQVAIAIRPSMDKLSFIVFGLPVLALFLGIGLGQIIGSVFLGGEYLSYIRGVFGGGFFLLSYIALIRYDRKLARSRTAYINHIVKRSGEPDAADPCHR